MSWWTELFKSPAARRAEQDKARRQGLTGAKTALRSLRRNVAKQGRETERLRREGVQYVREGKGLLAKQKAKQIRESENRHAAHSLALDNMVYFLEQAQTKDNYVEFMRNMQMVANLEELAQDSVDPDEVRVRLTELAERNQDIIEPWMEVHSEPEAPNMEELELSDPEAEIYSQLQNAAAGENRKDAKNTGSSEIPEMNKDLERKMDEAFGQE